MNGRPRVQYCGECLCRLSGDVDRCTECSAASDGLNYRQAQEHLLAMLTREPAADRRVRAISAFGQRGEPDRAAALVDIALQAPAGSPEALAVVRCLEHLLAGTRRNDVFVRLAEVHTDPEVRMAARRALLRSH